MRRTAEGQNRGHDGDIGFHARHHDGGDPSIRHETQDHDEDGDTRRHGDIAPPHAKIEEGGKERVHKS